MFGLHQLRHDARTDVECHHRGRYDVIARRLAIPQHDWPVIAMIETHTNQDACAGATLTLHYSAKAT